MTRAGLCIGLLAAIAVAPSQLQAQGGAPPVLVSVLSPRSTSGTFTLSISGVNPENCRALAEKVRLDRAQTPLALDEVTPCSFVLTPSTPLAAGTYCLSVGAFTGTFGARCFDVTNVQAAIAQARVVLESKGKDIWSPASCLVCPNSRDGNSCTQRARGRDLVAFLKDVTPELASEYAFAVTDGLDGEPSREPMSEDFGLFDGSLARVLTGSQRDDSGPCATVFARRLGTTTTVTVGRACIAPVLPSVVPYPSSSTPNPCEADYWARWCQDNRQPCASSAADDAACQDHARRCAQASPDGGVEFPVDAGADATTPGDEDGEAEGGTSEDAGSSATSRKGGCQIGTRSAVVFPSWLVLTLGPLIWRRRKQEQVSRGRRA